MLKQIQKALKGFKNVVFLDFEGTQFSHEMIAIGAVSAQINPKTGRIKKSKKPFRIYVKAKNKIGTFVENLTGINEAKLLKDGVVFQSALEQLKKYVGISFKKSVFITFGNHDLRILNQSISYNMAYPKEICSTIHKNYVDFAAIISEFVKDDAGNPLSLVHYCELFGIKEYGVAHDPVADAVNLMNLYDQFLAQKDLVIEQYKKVLQKYNNHFPAPVAETIVKLANGETITGQNFEESLKKYIS